MKSPALDSPLDADTIVAIATDIRPVELTARSRDSMRERILRRATRSAPEGTTTLRDTEGVWVELLPGVSRKILHIDHSTGTQTYLLAMEPGSQIPAHPHVLDEHCFVVHGEALVDDHLLRGGDWHVAKAGVINQEIFSPSGCLLLLRSELHSR